MLHLPGCREARQGSVEDHPRLVPDVILKDVTFHSDALGRDMQYRVLMPVTAGERKLPMVFLLHGGGGNFRDWSNYSNVAQFATDFLLVMPEGGSSYYANAVVPQRDRFEDYIIRDLPADLEKKFPARADRGGTAIMGVSMGGFGAVNLALHHPDKFFFVGSLSAAIDVPRRHFTWRRLEQSRRFERIFGVDGSPTRKANDPFQEIPGADPGTAPYFYVSCGQQEGLLPANREFAHVLKRSGFAYEFHEVPGGHNWNQWNGVLATIFDSLRRRSQVTNPGSH